MDRVKGSSPYGNVGLLPLIGPVNGLIWEKCPLVLKDKGIKPGCGGGWGVLGREGSGEGVAGGITFIFELEEMPKSFKN